MIDSLAILQAGLSRSFAGGPKSAREMWSDPAGMARAYKRVQHDHGGAGIAADPRSIMAAIADFRKSGEITGFRDLKYVCLGMGALDEKGWSALADASLRSTVARMAEQQPLAHRRLRCFQALLSTYFSFSANSENASKESKMGWRGLRKWLRIERDCVLNLIDVRPPWFEALLRYPELLTNQPCDKFGFDILNGDVSCFNDAKESLSIPENSWVIEEAVFAQMKAASNLEDSSFKVVLPRLLDIILGRADLSIGETLRIRCVAHLVSRYARCSDRPEQHSLQDAATSAIGNPWFCRTNWDAYVRVDDKADDQAREMVSFWLKERLVSDFFELLGTDGVNDRRRVAYWLRFVPFVEDMWFALGTSALSRRGGKFGEFRERAKGRLLRLEGTTADNNAFVMRIGSYLAIEFGAAGNAFYLFRWDSLSPSLLDALNSGRLHQRVHINQLRRDVNQCKLRHVDSPVALKSWEQKFDDKLINLIGKKPQERPACVPELEVLIAAERVEVIDRRGVGGALWVYETKHSSYLATKLRAMDFEFRANHGWFKE